MEHNELSAIISCIVILSISIIPLMILEKKIISNRKKINNFFENELKLSFHIPYKNTKDSTLIIFSKCNGFTKEGVVEAFKILPYKASRLQYYDKEELKELVKFLKLDHKYE